MANITIRSANKADLNSLINLEKQFDSDNINKKSFNYFLSKKDPAIFVAQSKDKHICGYILILTRKNSKKARIYSLIVDSSIRAKGIGYLLMFHAMAIFSKYSFTLEVKTSNEKAINFYKKIGFTVKTIIENYYSDGENAYKMVLENKEEMDFIKR